MKKYILGINLPLKAKAHESGVALLDMDGRILFAANEERFSRVKIDGDFPEKTIYEMFKYLGISSDQIAFVCVPRLRFLDKILRMGEFVWVERRGWIFKLEVYKKIIKLVINESVTRKLKGNNIGGFVMKYYWKDFLKNKFPKAKIVEIDHHLAHAAGAYYTSPWEETLIITLDGAGNFLTSIVATGRRGKIKIIDKTFVPHSVGSFWGSITRVCGFKSGTRHGGKVTGLAARGNPEMLIEKFRSIIRCEGLRIKSQENVFFKADSFIPNWESYEPVRMKEYIGDATREDVAAAAQLRLEEVVLTLVKNAHKKTGLRKVVLAGGVFANVLLNEKILELSEIDDVYIFPAMSDGGLACGAALMTLANIKIQEDGYLRSRRLDNAYLGPSYQPDEIEAALKKINVFYSRLTKPAEEIARLIYDNKIIALFSGRMEFGPRALGSRSIIYAPIDPTANDWLNKKLNRSEFMPFAPVTMIEYIKENYVGIVDDPVAAKFMTVTYKCTEKMIKNAPACVHVDGTARPQVIKRNDNPYYYDIINEYYKLSGIPTLINTSFNMHEEPIVASPYDAIKAFLDSGLDYLVMDDYICSYQDNKHIKIKNNETDSPNS